MSPKVATSLDLDETWQDCSGKVTTSAKVVHLPEDFFLLALGLPKVNFLRKNDQKSPGEKCWRATPLSMLRVDYRSKRPFVPKSYARLLEGLQVTTHWALEPGASKFLKVSSFTSKLHFQ